MLTATYSLLAIRFEQKNARGLLARLRHYLQAIQRKNARVDQSTLLSMISQLQHFDQHLHARKIEKHVIPVLCCATDEADLLLEELERLSLSARQSLSALQRYVHWCANIGDHQSFFSVAEHYCESISQRLVQEEKSLMSVIGAALTREDWFALGARFLTEDGEKYMLRSGMAPSVPLTAVIFDESTASH